MSWLSWFSSIRSCQPKLVVYSSTKICSVALSLVTYNRRIAWSPKCAQVCDFARYRRLQGSGLDLQCRLGRIFSWKMSPSKLAAGSESSLLKFFLQSLGKVIKKDIWSSRRILICITLSTYISLEGGGIEIGLGFFWWGMYNNNSCELPHQKNHSHSSILGDLEWCCVTIDFTFISSIFWTKRCCCWPLVDIFTFLLIIVNL